MKKQHKIFNKTFFIALIGFFLGALVGLFIFGGWVWSIRWTDALPRDLRLAAKEQMLRLVIQAYNRDQDALKAQKHFSYLGEDSKEVLEAIKENPGNLSSEQIAEFEVAIRGAPSVRPTPEIAPQRVLVRFRDASAASASLQAANASMLTEYSLVPGLQLLAVSDVDQAIQTLSKDPNVQYVEPDYVVTAAVEPNDPYYGNLWGLVNLQAAQAWDIYSGDPNQVVAIIDTGIDYNHPDLASNIWTNPGEIPANGLDDEGNGYIDDVHGYDFYNNDSDPLDDNSHGTHVAGTIGAMTNNGLGVSGINWQVSMAALKFLDASGSGYISGAISAIQYAGANGIKTSNNSWGTSYSQALYDAMQNIGQAHDHLFIAAAGNTGTSTDLIPIYPGAFDLDNIISVAAITESDVLAGFSTWGPSSVDLAAPGINILSTIRSAGYAAMNGTSMATPHVTGVSLLLRGLHPDWAYSQVKTQILSTTRHVDALTGKVLTSGVLNALSALGDQNPPPIPTPPPQVTPTPTPQTNKAQDEQTIVGRKKGSYTNTWYLDGVAEELVEKGIGSQPKTDGLEHRFAIALPRTPKNVLCLVAWYEGNETFSVYYWMDGNKYSLGLTVDNATETRAEKCVDLPSDLTSGWLWFEFQDDDRSPVRGNDFGSLFIDLLEIRGR